MLSSYNKIRGFTLIELMVAMLIVGVIMAIAIPSYKKSVQKGHRSQAEQLMQSIASKEVEYMLDARAYTSTVGSGGLMLASSTSPYQTSGPNPFVCNPNAATCTNAFYSVTVSVDNTATPPSFSIAATAIGQQVGDGDLNLDNTGAKTRMVSGVDQGW
jgi:type IV pilus assembly protein PilE